MPGHRIGLVKAAVNHRQNQQRQYRGKAKTEHDHYRPPPRCDHLGAGNGFPQTRYNGSRQCWSVPVLVVYKGSAYSAHDIEEKVRNNQLSDAFLSALVQQVDV